MKGLWSEETAKEFFFRYLPEKFRKRTPPTKYFWQLYAKIHPQKFKETVDSQVKKFTSEAKADTKITITEEFSTLMKRIADKPDDLVVLSCLKRNKKS